MAGNCDDYVMAFAACVYQFVNLGASTLGEQSV